MSILSLRRWVTVAYDLEDAEGHQITMELKRLRFDEANRLLVANMQAFGALQSATPAGQPDNGSLSMAEKMAVIQSQAEAAQRFCEALKPELMEWIWRDCIRKVGGIEDEDGPVTTGEALSAFADQRMVLWLLTKLQANASLTSQEGKASSSPSTSGSGGATQTGESGASPVQSIGGGSEASSTATGN